MEILRSTEALRCLRGPVFLAIGIFDGVHRGHQALLAEAQADARKSGGTAVALTFEPHPMMFFHHTTPPCLTSPRHKELLMERLGMTHLAVLPFNAARAAQTAEDFVAELVANCRPLGGICVGEAWRFGRERAGDVALLRKMGGHADFEVDAIPAVRLEGDVISSTSIRHAIARGDLKFAEAALGRPYSVLGPVVAGRKLGRTLGFPTANIDTDGFQLPPDGVYRVRVKIDGDAHRGVANLGVRPTLPECSARTLEVYILDFAQEIYGEELEVEFLQFMRPEKKFDSMEELRAQIARDVGKGRESHGGTETRRGKEELRKEN